MTSMKRFSAVALVAIAGIGVGGVEAAVVERFSGDANFTQRCGGGDNFGCEYVVAEGRAGNRATNGNTELALFNRIDNTAVSGQYQSGNFAAANSFTLSYDGAGTTSLNYLGSVVTLTGVNFGQTYGGDNPTAPAKSIYVRVRDTNLSSLALTTGGSSQSLGELTGIGITDPQYLVIAAFDITLPWTITGEALLGSGNNSASAFQLKVTDVAAVPLPATALLFGSALLGLAGVGYRRKRAACSPQPQRHA